MLTSYDGHPITYDGVGNPLTDGTWTYTWEHGRELAQMRAEKVDGNKDISITYTYDANGMRTGKTVTTKNYTLHTHSYTKTVVEPTCTKKGYTLYQCACGYSYQDDWVPALGHIYMGNSNICRRCGHDRSSDFVYPGPVKPRPPVETDSVGTGYASSALPGTQDLGSAESTELVLQSTVVETYSYVYTGGRLTQETVTTVTTTDEGTETTTDTLDYFYGVNGPTMVTWNGTDYYYLTNAQGDIVALLDESGNSAVQYSYDAWGNATATTGSMADTLGSRNSLRYRGYVFDTETGLYYLQSRYFNPKMARFINADALVSTGQGLLGNNMFAYCNNNPVNMLDPAGMFAKFLHEFLEKFTEWVTTPLGVLRYVTELTKKGELYEYWVDINDKVRWSRHHSNHGNSKEHTLVPHDHEWHDDDNGNNTQSKISKPPNPNFQAPNTNKNNTSKLASEIAGAAVVGFVLYECAKWAIASFTAPLTGGGSLIAAGVTP